MRKILAGIFRALVRSHAIILLIPIFRIAIKKVGGSGRTILALSPCRYRGDLEILCDRFRILKIGDGWQSRINYAFLGQLPYEEHFAPSPEAEERQRQLMNFLRKFLKALYARYKVDAVISSAVHNQVDYYWGWASEEIGVPFIILHRENAIYSEGAIKKYMDKWGKLGTFKGSLVITGNSLVSDVLADCNFTTSDKIKSLGCLRMDSYVQRCREISKERKVWDI